MKLERLTTRQCRISDHNYVYRLTRRCLCKYIIRYRKWDKNYFDKHFKERYKNRLIITSGKRKIGMYEIQEMGNHLFITNILLTESYRNKGIGSYLINKFIKETKKKKVRIEYWEGNPAGRLYKRLGFKQVEKRDHKIILEKQI